VNLSEKMQSLYLREGPNGEMGCFMKKDEVLATLHACATPTTEAQASTRAAMQELLAAYESGEMKELPSAYTNAISIEATSKESLPIEHDDSLQELLYKNQDKAKSPESKNNKHIAISEMDIKALKQVTPEGSLEPPAPGLLFPSGELRIPSSTGFMEAVAYHDVDPSPFQAATSQTILPEKILNIQYPLSLNRTSVLRVPWGMYPASLSSDAEKIAAPTPTDPLLWHLRKSATANTIDYTLATLSAKTLSKADIAILSVSDEEKNYWQSALPLPAALQQRIDQEPPLSQEKVHLLLAYLQHKPSGSDLSNFRYVCHPRLGRFLRENADDLPLLISELKVGHCDILAWYLAAQLRAQGIPAWAVSCAVTTPEGDAFNAAYGHSIVGMALEEGRMLTCDPTRLCDFDKAMHPAVLQDEDIDTLEEKFLDCDTFAQKIAVLRSFMCIDMLEIRTRMNDPEKAQKVLGDLSAFNSAAFANRDSEPFLLDEKNLRLEGTAANWNALPKEISRSTLQTVLRELSNSFRQETIMHFDLGKKEFQALCSKSTRQSYAWAMEAARVLQLPLTAKSMGFSETLDEFYYDPKTIVDILHSPYRGTLLGHCAKKIDASTFLAHSHPDEWIDLLSINFFNDFFDLPLYVLQRSEQENAHKYSSQFLTCLQNGFLPNFITPQNDVDLLAISKNADESRRNQFYKKYKPKELANDMALLSLKLQYFLAGKESKGTIMDSLGLHENQLHELLTALSIIKISPQKKMHARHLPLHIRTRDIRIQKALKRTFEQYTLPTEYKGKIEKELRRQLTRLRAVDDKEARGYGETRAYVPGDDMRYIDWHATARSERIFTKLLPERNAEGAKPLTIFIDRDLLLSDSYVSPLQIVEILRVLQTYSKTQRCPVYLTSSHGEQFQLSLQVPAEQIALSFALYEERLEEKPMPEPDALLYITERSGQKLLAKYLYGKKFPIEVIHLAEDPFITYPICKEKWIEEGFSEKNLPSTDDEN
jgi:DNA-dependent RNA polymerase auxiliary subunit epsilon